MITNWFLSRFSDTQREDIAFGLAFGLFAGVVFGLFAGVVFGLFAGVAFGLAFGLIAGLASGRIAGLFAGPAFGLAFGLIAELAKIITLGLLSIPQAVILIISILVISEILFFLDKSKPEDKRILWFTIKRNGEALIETSLIVVNALNVMLNWKAIATFIEGISPVVIQLIGYVGIVIVAGLIIYGYFWLNSLRYRKQATKRR